MKPKINTKRNNEVLPQPWDKRWYTLSPELRNTEELTAPRDWPLEVLHDTEIKARIHGVQAIMQAFDIIFCCFKALNHTDDLSDRNVAWFYKML